MEINISYNEFWDEPWPLCLLPCLNLCVQDVYWARVIVHVLQPLDPHSQRFTPQDWSADQNIRIVILFKFQFPSLPSTGHLINDAVLVKILEFFDTWCMNHIIVSAISPMHVFKNWEISYFFLPRYFLIEYTCSMRLCLQSFSVSRACCISCLLRRANVPIVRCSFSGFWNMLWSIPLSYKNTVQGFNYCILIMH